MHIYLNVLGTGSIYVCMYVCMYINIYSMSLWLYQLYPLLVLFEVLSLGGKKAGECGLQVSAPTKPNAVLSHLKSVCMYVRTVCILSNSMETVPRRLCNPVLYCTIVMGPATRCPDRSDTSRHSAGQVPYIHTYKLTYFFSFRYYLATIEYRLLPPLPLPLPPLPLLLLLLPLLP